MKTLRAWLVWGGCVLCAGACADTTQRVRTRAARDFSCAEAQTKIVDGESGVYKVAGCGLQASYECHEDGTSLSMRCQQLYVSKLPAAPEKPTSGSSLAKGE
ncbi:MAG: hypothetical protein ACHQ53_13540 [Polyangiales bacterium]